VAREYGTDWHLKTWDTTDTHALVVFLICSHTILGILNCDPSQYCAHELATLLSHEGNSGKAARREPCSPQWTPQKKLFRIILCRHKNVAHFMVCIQSGFDFEPMAQVTAMSPNSTPFQSPVSESRLRMGSSRDHPNISWDFMGIQWGLNG
jgi:hypothetical protein